MKSSASLIKNTKAGEEQPSAIWLEEELDKLSSLNGDRRKAKAFSLLEHHPFTIKQRKERENPQKDILHGAFTCSETPFFFSHARKMLLSAELQDNNIGKKLIDFLSQFPQHGMDADTIAPTIENAMLLHTSGALWLAARIHRRILYADPKSLNSLDLLTKIELREGSLPHAIDAARYLYEGAPNHKEAQTIIDGLADIAERVMRAYFKEITGDHDAENAYLSTLSSSMTHGYAFNGLSRLAKNNTAIMQLIGMPLPSRNVLFSEAPIIAKHAETSPDVHLVSYASPEFAHNQEQLLKTGIETGGITSSCSWSRSDLEKTEVYRRYRPIFDCKRGAGYWAWKPYIILSSLLRVNDGDFVIYHDGGSHSAYKFYNPINDVLKLAAINKGCFYGYTMPWHGGAARFTKRDCFVHMNCDEPKYWLNQQLYSRFSVWQKNDYTLDVVWQWMINMLDPRICMDLPDEHEELPIFIDHRHCQSILTNIALMRGDKMESGDIDFYIH